MTTNLKGGLSKDLLVGCLALVAVAIILASIPLLVIVLKLSLWIAIPLGIILIIAILLACFGRIIRLLMSLFEKKQK